MEKTGKNQILNIELLRLIALTRVCLEASAYILSAEGQKFINSKMDDQLKQNFMTFRADFAIFIKKFQNTELHMFLCRYIIHKYGEQELNNILEEFPQLLFSDKDDDKKVSEITNFPISFFISL